MKRTGTRPGQGGARVRSTTQRELCPPPRSFAPALRALRPAPRASGSRASASPCHVQWRGSGSVIRSAMSVGIATSKASSARSVAMLENTSVSTRGKRVESTPCASASPAHAITHARILLDLGVRTLATMIPSRVLLRVCSAWRAKPTQPWRDTTGATWSAACTESGATHHRGLDGAKLPDGALLTDECGEHQTTSNGPTGDCRCCRR